MDKRPISTATTIKPPKMPRRAQLKDFSGDQLQSRERYSGLQLINTSLAARDLERIAFDESVFTHVEMNDTHIKQPELLDVRCTDCNFSNAEWLLASLQRVEVVRCYLTGLRLVEARFQDVLFKNCSAKFAQFRFASFKNVSFVECDFSEADFQGADLTGVTFLHCNLSLAEMSGAKLAGADLRTCNLEGMHAGFQELRGASINSTYALALVRAMGIIIA